MSFQGKVEAIEEHLRAQRLSILIWGPAPHDPSYVLRQQIRHRLAAEFYNSDIAFSEELESKNLSQTVLSEHEMALFHVAACDLVIVLAGSLGILGEIDSMLSSPFAHKLLLIRHEQSKDSSPFFDRLRHAGKLLSYSDYDLETCSIVEKIAVRVQEVALDKMIRLVL